MKPIYLLRGGLCLGLSLLAVQTLRAQRASTDSIPRSVSMDEVVVTGTQTPRLLKRLPIITRVVSNKDLERLSPRSVIDALQMSVPGITITTHGAQYRVTLQGFSGDHILFLVDGERLTSEGNGVVDLNRIDLSSIERIEIISGAASALYGSNAIGGVVNFITKQASRDKALHLNYDYSGEGIARYNASIEMRSGSLSGTLGLGIIDQHAYSIPTSGRSRSVAPVLGSVSYNLSHNLRYRSPDLMNEVSGYVRLGYRDQDDTEVTRNHYLSHSIGGRVYHAFSALHNLRLDYNHEQYDRSRHTQQTGEKEPIFDFGGHTIRLQYNYGAENETKVFVNAGAEGYFEQLRGDRFTDTSTQHSAQLYTIYGQGEWRLSPHFSAVGGFRQDMHSLFGSHFTPRLSLLYSLGQVRLRASYSEGFRSPSIKEQYMDWDHMGMFFIKGTQGLKPETSRMVNFSPEWQTKYFNLTGIASYNVLYNPIGMTYVSNENAYHYTNTAETSRQLNLQASLRLRLPWGLNFSGNYSFVYDFSQDEERADGQPFAPLRPHNFTANLGYERQLRGATIALNYTLRGASSVVLSNYNSLTGRYSYVDHEGYLLSRLALSMQTPRRLGITLGVDNLTNYLPDQVNITGSLSPGRQFFMSMSYHLW